MLSLFFFALCVAICRPLTVLLHELGHAIPALLLTAAKTSIYIGSYGDEENSRRISIGKLEIWFRYNLLEWKQGLCIPHAKKVTVNRQIIYTICGPLTSLLVAITLLYLAFVFDCSALLTFVLLTFLVSAVIDLVTNLRPNPVPIKLHSGTIVYNDGYALLKLFRMKAELRKNRIISSEYNIGNYKRVVEMSRERLKVIRESDWMIYRYLISSLCQLKEYQTAYDCHKEFCAKYDPTANDLSLAALLLSKLGFRNESIAEYKKSLQLEPDDAVTLNNFGYSLILANEYNAALQVLDKSVALNDKFAFAFNNRGHVKLMLGFLEEGVEDIREGLELDPANAYGYRNLGIYHLLKNEPRQALNQLIKAKEMDTEADFIDDHIAEARRLLN